MPSRTWFAAILPGRPKWELKWGVTAIKLWGLVLFVEKTPATSCNILRQLPWNTGCEHWPQENEALASENRGCCDPTRDALNLGVHRVVGISRFDTPERLCPDEVPAGRVWQVWHGWMQHDMMRSTHDATFLSLFGLQVHSGLSDQARGRSLAPSQVIIGLCWSHLVACCT